MKKTVEPIVLCWLLLQALLAAASSLIGDDGQYGITGAQ
jgi:hypothetical protein